MRLLVVVGGGQGRYVAAAPGLPGFAGEGATRAQALANLRALVSEHGPWRFGRSLCDRVRRELDSDGFFTTDELPAYGIAADELAGIRSASGAGAGDCVVLYAYPREQAQRIDDYLYSILRGLVAGRDR